MFDTLSRRLDEIILWSWCGFVGAALCVCSRERRGRDAMWWSAGRLEYNNLVTGGSSDLLEWMRIDEHRIGRLSQVSYSCTGGSISDSCCGNIFP